MSLRTRMALAVGLVAALAVGIAAVTAHEVTARALDREVDQFLIDRAERTARLIAGPQRSDRSRGRNGPAIAQSLATPDAIVQVVDRDGAIVASIQGVDELPLGPKERGLLGNSRARPVLRTISVDNIEYRMITHPTPTGAVQVARSQSETDAVLSRIDRRLLLFGLVGSAMAALIGRLIAQRIVAPISALTAKAERVAATQDLSEPIDVDGRDEIGRLGRAFNRMLHALDLSRRQQQRLIQDAGHELRTPLTSIRTNIDVLGRRFESIDSEMRNQILADLSSEVDEMTNLVAEVVLHASGQGDQSEPAECSLADIALDVASRYERRSGRAIGVDASQAGPTMVMARPDQIDRAISNLVANAIKFTPDGSPIVLVVGDNTVECQDRGPGISPQDTERIFDRFYRPASSRTEPGSGLGLAIVEQIARSHHGRVWARNRNGGGAAIGFAVGVNRGHPRPTAG